MAETNATKDKSTETRKKSKEFTIALSRTDGHANVVVHLEANEDAAQPPRLIDVHTKSLDSTTSISAQDQETHIILSTGSGHQLASSFFENVVFPILRELFGAQRVAEMRTHITQSPTSVLEVTRDVLFKKANEGVPLRIILASGDGGIVDLVNGLLAQPAAPAYKAPQVVLLPLGTANALYHSINSDAFNTWGLNALSSTSSKPLPVFTANFSPEARLLVDEARVEERLPEGGNGNCVLHGAVVCSWGMHASLVADSDTTEYRKFGVERFKMAAKEALYPADGSAPHPYKAKVSVLKGEDWITVPEEEHMYVLSTMVSKLEKLFCISPASKPLDGSMHLVHFGPTSGDEAMRIMGLAYQGGKHVQDPAIRYENINGLRIDFEGKEEDDRWRRICVDGKIVKVEKNGWVEVRKEPTRVLDVVLAA